MDFNNDRPIFRQIAELCHDRILRGDWIPGQKIPSVREMAMQLAVNTHTVLKALELLQDEQVIEPRRGMGYFLTPDAHSKVMEARRRDFFEQRVPALRKEMEALGISMEDLLNRL